MTLEQQAELLSAAKGVIAAFDAGVFVRNIANDHEPDWAIKAFPHLIALGRLDAVVCAIYRIKEDA